MALDAALSLVVVAAVAAVAAASASAAPAPPPLPPDFAAYGGSAALLRNPERGFRFELDFPITAASLVDALALNCSLVQTYAYLPASNPPQPLPQATLDELGAGFAALRAAGLKAVLRFAYDRQDPGETNYTFETIALHQQNLMAVLANNADVVFALEAGFVGSWGEWHSSLNKLEANETALAALVANELYGGLGLPTSTFVLLRYSALKDKVLRPSPPLSPAQQAQWPAMTFGIVDSGSAGSQVAAARLGYHNDGFLSTPSDGDTYYSDLPAAACGAAAAALPIVPLMCSLDGPIADLGYEVTTREAPWLPVGGEMYWNAGGNGSGTLAVDGHTAAHRLFAQHFTYLSIVHGLAPYGSSKGGAAARARGRGRVDAGGLENINRWMLEPLNISRLWNCGGPSWFPCGMPVADAYAAAIDTANLTTFDYIRDALGYRIQLNGAYVPSNVTLGGTLSVAVYVSNYGFAAPLNPRLVYVVLIDAAADAIAFITHFPGVDVRDWQPHVPGDPQFATLAHFAGASPELELGAVAPGTYFLGIFMPDASPVAASNASAFSIRLANRECATLAEAGSGSPACTFFWQDKGGAGGVNVLGPIEVLAAR